MDLLTCSQMANGFPLSVGNVMVMFEFSSFTGVNNRWMQLLENTVFFWETLAVLLQMLQRINFLLSVVIRSAGTITPSHCKDFWE